MKIIKSFVCLTVAATVLMALNAPAKTVATDDANNAAQGITQSAETVVNMAKIVMGNTLGGYSVTPVFIPEPSTLLWPPWVERGSWCPVAASKLSLILLTAVRFKTHGGFSF